jgi:membrane associated rhomboid family serine protease
MQQQISFQAWPFTRAVKIILIANAAIWLVTVLLSKVANGNFLFINLALTPRAVFSDLHIWQPFTYMWLHDIRGFSHILFNCLFLWMFGGSLEESWGTRKFVTFYLICGIGSGLVVLMTGLILNPDTMVVGASGAIYGLIAAWAISNPDRLIYLFGIFPIKAKHFALLPIGYAVLDLLVEGSIVSHSAHLGGLAIGAIYVSLHPGKLKDRLLYWYYKRKLKVIEGGKSKISEKKPKEKQPPGGGYWH